MAHVRSVALVLALLAVAGCGNWVEDTEQVGWLGVRADDRGQPVVVIVPCRSGTPFVDLSGVRTEGMSDDEVNASYGTWSATTSTDEIDTLSLTAPGDGWSPVRGVTLEPGLGYIVGGGFTDRDQTVLIGLDFTLSDLSGLGAGEVLVSDGAEEPKALPQAALESKCRS